MTTLCTLYRGKRADSIHEVNQCSSGDEHTIDCNNVYEDVIDLYRQGEIVGEYPIMIEFLDEIGIDHGGLRRDMFSSFWEKVYAVLFEGATLLIPMIHPTLLPIIGRILFHAFFGLRGSSYSDCPTFFDLHAAWSFYLYIKESDS